jgi:hypothetical protein
MGVKGLGPLAIMLGVQFCGERLAPGKGWVYFGYVQHFSPTAMTRTEIASWTK